MTLFHNITIIGLGLIGSSIARAAKNKNLCKKIIAFDNNKEYLLKAKRLDIIDVIAESLVDAVKQTDLIFLCTPIGTYNNIFDKISPYLNKNILISDVGSVKNSVITSVVGHLTASQLKNFIPSHPIAGSEKSGLDAGSKSLFTHKQLIITPTMFSSLTATEQLQEFWQHIGANVTIMDAKKHDHIYSLSSHLPHFISFCYAKALKKYEGKPIKEIISSKGDEFASFIRLCESNPIMWADIFIHNKEEILKNIDIFYMPPSFAKIKSVHDYVNITQRLKDAQYTRKMIKPIAHYKTKINRADIFTGILPKIIATITVESAVDLSNIGGGYLGITENIISLDNRAQNTIKNNMHELNRAISLLKEEIDHLYNAIKEDSKDKIIDYITDCGI
jgi:cyclohexadieny/prephenate dehydrogenase